MDQKFDDKKLNEFYNCAVECEASSSSASFRDQLSDDCGYVTYNTNECITDLMVYIKYHVENQFKRASEMLSGVCSSQKLISTTGQEMIFYTKEL